ncbi:hypothetical protein QFC20_005095 [Naganishia adeliensis]|uniref:Uncharacterized protein n=1 Tax=Naganishia adeliensis TaxID=92952 RepID=A0ACC2VTX3_9TREE|nr:hypothetical protein QFC20_005095 [Naganishia adeliensis]
MSDGKIPNGRVQRARRTSWAYYRGIWRCRRFKDDIDSQELVLPLLVTSFVTGALDATCYADLATFAANQTGNVIIITVGVAHIAPAGHQTRLNAYSLAGYIVSGLMAARLGNYFGPRRRFWIMLSHLTQVALLASGMALLYADIISAGGIVMLLFFATTSGVQVAAARGASVPEIPTGSSCDTLEYHAVIDIFICIWQRCSRHRSWTPSLTPAFSNYRSPIPAFEGGTGA